MEACLRAGFFFEHIYQMKREIMPLLCGTDELRPLVIAGPCSAESECQTLDTARALSARGIRIFRAGLWKPRTKPGCFEGVGSEGLAWLTRVKRETGMYVATEIATAGHAGAALDAGIDLLWIGARTTSNPFAVQDIAVVLRGHDVPVLVKNPASPDLELWIGAIERLRNAGIRRLGAVHRGFGSFGATEYRNPPFWAVPIELRRRMPELPLLCDPSHIGGRRERVTPIAQQAMDLGFDGLLVESHCDPDRALSDPDQQLTPDELHRMLSRLTLRSRASDDSGLTSLRSQIDAIDDELLQLLARRMETAREIGRFKRTCGMPILQPRRYDQLLERRCAQAATLKLDEAFLHRILTALHEESVRQQMEIFSQ